MKTVFENLEYTLRKVPRAKRMRIYIKPEGKVLVTAPKWLPQYKVREYVESQKKWIQERLGSISVNQSFPKLSAYDLAKVKRVALKSFTSRLEELNAAYGFSYKRVSIRNQSTRWGSCSKSGTLSFNYRLYFLSPELQDYVLVHELCHLKEMNHASSFWRLVERVVPEYMSLRVELKKLKF